MIPSYITEETIQVAIDAIMRYRYPHMMPGLTVPYKRSRRYKFHPQHLESIDDLPNMSTSDKTSIKALFAPKLGESILDIGAYIGFGALRMSKEVGSTGMILAVEADPDALRLLELNVYCNRVKNVKIIPSAIWHSAGDTLIFHKTTRQANSLIPEIVDSSITIPVKTTSVDTILANYHRPIDMISLTVNGAEVEALMGMQETLSRCDTLRLSIAGWYQRAEGQIRNMITPMLKEKGFTLAVGQRGGILAWKEPP